MMPLSTIRTPPSLEDYIPLAEHQSKTPETFYGGKPVLHHHVEGAKAWIPASQAASLPIFPRDSTTAPTEPESQGLTEDSEEMREQKVDIFVTSENFTLFSVSAGVGVAIPYPAITLHAIKHYRGDPQVGVPALYMQLDLAPEGGDGDDDFETVELTLLLPPSPHNVELSGSGDDVTGTAARERESSTLAATRVLFDAVATCSNLHPDPSADSDEDEGEDNDRFRHRKLPSNKGGAFNGFVLHEDSVHNRNGHDDAATFDYDEAEESEGLDPGIVIPGRSDGGLPPPFPGSGGWITAENVDQFLDADGNWIGWSGSGGNEEDEEKDDGAGGEEPTNGAEPTDGETAVSDGKRPGDDSTEASEVKRARVGPS